MIAAVALSVALSSTSASPASAAAFHVVTLGADGGLEDGDLSAYLAFAPSKSKAVLLDAGTLVHGIERAKLGVTSMVLKERVGAALISHAHFDHVMGLVIASPDDAPRTIYALPSTIDALRDDVFNNVTWANFGDVGNAPQLKKYHEVAMQPGAPVHLADEGVDVTAWPLSHAGTTSTAFVVDAGDAAIVYCGDTGADAVEHSDALAQLFTHIAGLVRGKKLAALFIESSYPSARDDKLLFGHLTPKHLMLELHALAEAVDVDHAKTALKGLNVVVTHIKPTLDGTDPRKTISDELTKSNDLGVKFLFPQQGDALDLAPPR